MKKKPFREEEVNVMDFNELDGMSDEELQEAFAAGLIKPGLNIPCEEKTFKNNVRGLQVKLEELKTSLNWIEKMDLIVKPAPMAPEAHSELNESEKENFAKLKNRVRYTGTSEKDGLMDDFKREMLFHRQAQTAVLEGISRLKSMGVPTKRPDDYFAEMAKSDEHMHKVRLNLAARQAAAARSEKMKQLRRLKKLGKQTQLENKQKQAKEKKKMLTEVKKFKKGLRKDLNFLEGNSEKNSGKGGLKLGQNRLKRNERFGFGGKKKGSKRNTKESNAHVGGSLAKKMKKSGGRNNKRLGKSKRIKKKSRR